MNPDPSGILQQISSFDPATSQVPVLGLIVLGLTCGVILWLFGHKVLGPVVFILGGAIGAAAGIIAPQHLEITTIAGYPASLIGLVLGAILGALLAGALYRTAITLGSGLVFAVAGLITGLATLGPAGEPSAAELPPAVPVVDSTIAQNTTSDQTVPPTESSLITATERATTFVSASMGDVRQRWDALDEGGRLRVAAMTFGGLTLGLLIGLIAHQRASAVVTASLGSGVSLYSLAWLSTQSPMPWTDVIGGFGPREWVIAWGAAAIIGIIFQGLFIRPRAAPRPAPSPKPEE